MKTISLEVTRRQALKTTVVAAAACASFATIRPARAQGAAGSKSGAATGPFTLPALPYPTDALEPHIDARTMEIHHDKHHAAYVTNLNKAITENPELGAKPIEELLANLNNLPEKARM